MTTVTAQNGKRKILLVNPPSPFLLDERVFPPLGLLNIAAVAREQGHEVKLLDLGGNADYLNTILKEAEAGYDLIGFTATSPQFSYAYSMANALRKNVDTKLAIGGPHPSIVASLRNKKIGKLMASDPSLKDDPSKLEQLLNDYDPNFRPLEVFDSIVSGEENGIFVALNNNGAKWVDGGLSHSLDELPLPARDLIDMDDYLIATKSNGEKVIKFPLNGKPTANVMTQRGCPFDCYFCCGREVAQFRNVRSQSSLRVLGAEKLIQELNHLNEKYGLESFMFYDDEFNLDVRRTLKVCDALAETGYNFRGFIKSELLVRYPEAGEAMAKAGFVEILTGVEAGSDRILRDHVRKHTTPDINYQAAKILLQNGIGFKALCMVGHPTETYEDLLETKKWAIKVGKMFQDSGLPFSFDLTIHQPYPGAPV